jgi:putative addiction module component (TIGR02574 family)
MPSNQAEKQWEVKEAWRIEVERRLGQLDRGEVQLISGDEVFERLRRRLSEST